MGVVWGSVKSSPQSKLEMALTALTVPNAQAFYHDFVRFAASGHGDEHSLSCLPPAKVICIANSRGEQA
jgi:hypothetical protein